MVNLRVSDRSEPKSVAGALTALIKEKGKAEMNAASEIAVSQAVKAVAIARDYLAPEGIDIVVIPYLSQLNMQRKDMTSIRLVIETR
jgi:stage V sporulation protein S